MTSPTKPDTGPPSALAAALAEAQARCKPVSKDSTNKFHNYKYASAEAVYTEARNALDGTGLSLVPTASRVEMREGLMAPPFDPALKVPTLWLVREFDLVHTSGESKSLKIEWPIVMDRKGQTLDKAVAGAETSSLAYLYRDLLSMPRVDARDDLNFGRRGHDEDDEARAAEEFERAQRQAPKGRKTPSHNTPPSASSVQQGGARPSSGDVSASGADGNAKPVAASPSGAPSAEPQREPTPAQVAAAARLGPAAKQAISGTPDRPLSEDDEFALLVEIETKLGAGHKLVTAWSKKYGCDKDGKRARLPTKENARGLVGALGPELDALVTTKSKAPPQSDAVARLSVVGCRACEAIDEGADPYTPHSEHVNNLKPADTAEWKE